MLYRYLCLKLRFPFERKGERRENERREAKKKKKLSGLRRRVPTVQLENELNIFKFGIPLAGF